MRQIEIDAESQGSEPEFELPYVDGGEYLISMLSEIGEANVRSGHLSQLDWQDIESWINVTGLDISIWEAETMRHLSGVYVNQYYASNDENCVAPVLPQPVNREIVEKQMKSFFAMMRDSNG